MTDKDVGICLAAVFEFYGRESADPKTTIRLWHRYLCDEPYELVQMAFDRWIASQKWAPKPAEILEIVEQIKSELLSETLYEDPFGGNKKQIPGAYLPRFCTRTAKQFESLNRQRLENQIKALSEKLALEQEEKP